MTAYRKKPVVIEAKQWTGDNGLEIQAFLNDGHEFSTNGHVNGQYVDIGTLEGLMVASPGDWIIRGVKGEFYPCKPDIFDATYELEETVGSPVSVPTFRDEEQPYGWPEIDA